MNFGIYTVRRIIRIVYTKKRQKIIIKPSVPELLSGTGVKVSFGARGEINNTGAGSL